MSVPLRNIEVHAQSPVQGLLVIRKEMRNLRLVPRHVPQSCVLFLFVLRAVEKCGWGALCAVVCMIEKTARFFLGVTMTT
mmetsp:Transcript_70535/g.161822  ORF Transcript_70535/g.161822 Transcript_70535/m.161822 type:complete len:80 (-) Transcript_70535:25-264(-)